MRVLVTVEAPRVVRASATSPSMPARRAGGGAWWTRSTSRASPARGPGHRAARTSSTAWSTRRGRRELTIREALGLFCEREIARKDERRIEISIGLARFPFVRDLAGFDFAAQPSIDKGQIRELAMGRFIANGEALLLLGIRASARRTWRWRSGARPSRPATRSFRARPRRSSAQPAKAHPDGKLEERLTHFVKPKLLIVDELRHKTKRRLKRRVPTAADLQAGVNRYRAKANHDLKPFTWTANPDKIIAAVDQGRQM